MNALRVLTIGWSPRPDLAAEMAAAVPGLQLDIMGALDGVTPDDAPRPAHDADALYALRPSGAGIAISKAAVTRALLPRLGHAGPMLLACTGTFDGLPARPSHVHPSAVLNALAGALLPRGRLGLFVPLPEQADTLAAARRRPGLDVVAVPLRPHADDAARDTAARAMAAHAPDLALLDCISYTRIDKARLGASLRCPILLSVAVAARAAASLLPEPPPPCAS